MSINQITRITIKNYRSILDLTVDLPALTVLVGENGSGKSNFIDALRFIGNALTFGLSRASDNRNTSGNVTMVQNADTVFEIHMNVDNQDRIYIFIIDRIRVAKQLVKYELYRSGGKTVFERTASDWLKTPDGLNPALLERDLFLPLVTGLPEVAAAYQFLTNMSFYNVFPDKIRELASPAMQSYPLADNGENLASVLHEFLDKSRWKLAFKHSLKNLLSYIQDIKAENMGGQIFISFEYNRHYPFPPQMSQSQESDGALHILLMLMAIYQDPPRALIALEEPELFIHPGALFTLCEIIKEASLRSQVIITTHSPDMIAAFDVNDLRVVERTEKGTQIGVIADTQRHAIEQKLFKASDLLRIDGQLHRALADEE